MRLGFVHLMATNLSVWAELTVLEAYEGFHHLHESDHRINASDKSAINVFTANQTNESK